MRKSKRQLFWTALGCLFFAFIFSRIPGGDIFASGSLWAGLFFTAWLLWKVYRDHQLSQGSPAVREVRADYQRPPEVMSKGSRGLPTSFD